VTDVAKLCPDFNNRFILLETLITSKTRIRILLKFFLNPDTKTYLRALSGELGESSNAVRVELNRLTEAGMLSSEKEGNKLLYRVNELHPLYVPVNALIRQYVGVDEIIENVIKGLGKIEKLYLSGSLANGLSSDIIDIVIIGEINMDYLLETIHKIEKGIEKKIRYVLYTSDEAQYISFDSTNFLLVYAP
jgi:DNA-binding transcriptional ArsR family regulator